MPYDSNLFFWFFESRGDAAVDPLTLWLQGGPGSPSADQALLPGLGPCLIQDDMKTLAPNPFSWNIGANMIFLDQPSGTGFSYDTASPGIVNMTTGLIDTTGQTQPAGLLTRTGTFSSQNPATAPYSSGVAARAVYQFMQAFYTA